jgi:hypothetical protein
LYTKNIELVTHHCEKSFFYYIEFIRQIDENNHSLLSLNSNDASYFVYKKTIYEINHEFRKNFNNELEGDECKLDGDKDINSKINNTNKMIEIYNSLLIKVVHSTILIHGTNTGNEFTSIEFTSTNDNFVNGQVISFENKMNKLSNIILHYLKGEIENDDNDNRFIELLNVMDCFVINYKNGNKCIVPYMEILLKKIKKRVGEPSNKLINSSEILYEITKRIQMTTLFMEDDDENGSNIFDNSVTPSKYIKLLIRE